MAHELEINEDGTANAFFGGNVKAWHGLGTVIEDDVVTSEQALQLANMDWTVSKEQMMYEVANPEYNPPQPPELGADASEDQYLEAMGKYEAELHAYEQENPEFLQFPVEDKYAVVRSSDHRLLGVVGEDYTCFQNHEAFAFGDALVDSSDAKWHTAGVLKRGSVVWMLMKLADDILIGGMEDERVEQYILISTSHDGSLALSCTVTDVRVVCQNTLTAALAGTQRRFKVYHTKNMDGNIIAARKTLELTFAYGARLKEVSEELLDTKMSDSEFNDWMDKILPMPKPELVAMTDESGAVLTDADGGVILTEKPSKGATQRDNIRTDVSRLYHQADNLENVRGTRYAAWQALVEYSDHHAQRRKGRKNDMNENRFLNIVDGSKLTQKGFDLLIA